MHYFLAKLSEKFAHQDAHITLDFEEDIVKNFDSFIQKIAIVTGLSKNEVAEYASKRRVPISKQYSTEEITWLENVEKECDEVIDKLGIINMSSQQLLNKPFLLVYSEKRKLFMQNVLANHYQLESKLIYLQGELTKTHQVSTFKDLFSKIKKKLCIS